jgi:hypothetical protein
MDHQSRVHLVVSRIVRPRPNSTNSRVYALRLSGRWWYTRSIEREVREKEVLKQRLDEKIEELKEKSDYYNTQQLLERYDPKSISPKEGNAEFRDLPPNQQHLQKPSIDNFRQRQGLDNLRQRGPVLPPLPPPITPATFTPQPQNIPSFHPSAFSPPPSPTLAPQQHHSKTFLDRVLDLIVGEDENAADHRYALICRHCRAHNGLAPPGERGEDVGYLCGRCGGWNGPEPNKPKKNSKSNEEKDNAEKVAKVEDKVAEENNGRNEMMEKTQVTES